MTITARYPGKCGECGDRINVGDRIEWDPKTRKAIHYDCVSLISKRAKGRELPATTTAPAKKVEKDVIRISGGEGYGWRKMSAGQIVRNTKRNIEAGGPEWLYVVKAWQHYYSEDGMSFGVGDDEGYIYGADCRPATDEEAAPRIAEVQAAQARKAAKARVAEIAKMIREAGERPEKADGNAQGERLVDTQDIYGGGDWFALTADGIWYVRNNGMDGDDWSCNNVATGGAGAIGWRIPMDEALAEELRRLAQTLVHLG